MVAFAKLAVEILELMEGRFLKDSDKMHVSLALFFLSLSLVDEASVFNSADNGLSLHLNSFSSCASNERRNSFGSDYSPKRWVLRALSFLLVCFFYSSSVGRCAAFVYFQPENAPLASFWLSVPSNCASRVVHS